MRHIAVLKFVCVLDKDFCIVFLGFKGLNCIIPLFCHVTVNSSNQNQFIFYNQVVVSFCSLPAPPDTRELTR